MIRLHLVSGFLGSGKTTAIVAAAKRHLARGERVGVVTNDQGRYLVDTAFVQAQNVPAVQVSGGCFCCNYDDLVQVLAQLQHDAQPDVIYAESVGSCADLIATVVQPLRALRQGGIPPTSLSAFADARLLLRHLRGQPLPFSDDVVYILSQQLAEAELLVANKVDLLSSEDRRDLEGLLAKRYGGKRCLLQNALAPEGVIPWVQAIESGQATPSDVALDVDYGRYGEGERRLAWLDQELLIQAPRNGREALEALVVAIEQAIRLRGWPIAHCKFLARSGGRHAKISLTALQEPEGLRSLPELGHEIELTINARVEADAQELRQVIGETLRAVAREHGLVWQLRGEQAFYPEAPSARPAR